MMDMVRNFFERFKAAPGREYQQVIYRLVFAAGMFFYIGLNYAGEPDIFSKTMAALPFAIVFITIHTLWLYLSPKKSVRRYLLASIIDTAGISYAMYVAGEAGAFFFPIYLWIAYGYGFRFGRHYTTLVASLSITGFFLAYLFSEYWNNIPFVSFSLGFTIFLTSIAVWRIVNSIEEKLIEIEKAKSAKSEFLANMSHELITPINGITGSNELLRFTRLNDDQKEYVSTIKKSANTLLTLIRNILTISKIESGKEKFLYTQYDLHQVLSELVREYMDYAKTKGLSLRLNIASNVPFTLIGDSPHLVKALSCLVDNAIKFTHDGGVVINVKNVTEDIKSEKPRLRFEVIDTGPGISENIQSGIFSRFTQIYESDTSNFAGSGVGTAITREIIEALDGTIGLESKEGEGSTFWFELDIDRYFVPHEEKHDLVDTNVLVITSESSDLLTGSVLDDLKTWQINVVVSKNGSEALSLCKENIYHAVVLTRSVFDFNPNFFAREVKVLGQLSESHLILFLEDDYYQQEDILNSYDSWDYVLPYQYDKSVLYNAIHSAPSVIARHHIGDDENVERFSDHFLSRTQNARVLLVDDNELNLNITKKMLKKGGFLVDTALDGDQALQALDEQDYDLCIMDMQMPNINGQQAVEIFKMTHPESNMPFIMLTANTVVDVESTSKSLKVDRYLTKPVRYNSLILTVNELLQL